jgi:hypothetical protein
VSVTSCPAGLNLGVEYQAGISKVQPVASAIIILLLGVLGVAVFGWTLEAKGILKLPLNTSPYFRAILSLKIQ